MSAELWFAIASLALGIIGTCFSALASIIAYFVKRGEDAQDKSIGQLREDHAIVRHDVDVIKQTLAKYESHVGAGDARLSEIRQDIQDHVTKEENIFWKKVEAISEAQRVFSEAVLQRVASMEARLPNGELKELTVAVARIEAALVSVAEKAAAADKHVVDHNVEAEDWKRRIVALETGGSPRRRSVRGKK